MYALGTHSGLKPTRRAEKRTSSTPRKKESLSRSETILCSCHFARTARTRVEIWCEGVGKGDGRTETGCDEVRVVGSDQRPRRPSEQAISCRNRDGPPNERRPQPASSPARSPARTHALTFSLSLATSLSM